MTALGTMQRRAITLALLLASALAVPGSIAAVPTDASDFDIAAPRRADTPAAPSLWEAPTPARVAVGPTTQPRQAEPGRTPSANPLWAIPLATLSNTRERPIFSPTRRPPPAVVPPVTAAQAPPPKPLQVERPQLSLVGTIASSEQSIGILVDETSKAALRLKLGEEYQGWRLRAVQPREVTLERDQQTIVLSMPQPSESAPAPVSMQAENSAAQEPADVPPRQAPK